MHLCGGEKTGLLIFFISCGTLTNTQKYLTTTRKYLTDTIRRYVFFLVCLSPTSDGKLLNR